VNNLPMVVVQLFHEEDLNPRLVDRKSTAVPSSINSSSGCSLCLLLLLLDEFWSNSQYCLHLRAPDRSVFARRSDDDQKCQVIVSLMQKHSRRNRTLYRIRSTEVAMTFDLYKV